jgi:uncharacterized membrane protein YfcA
MASTLKGTSDKMSAGNLFEDIHAQPLREFHHPLLIGLLGGVASVISHAGGVIISIYMLRLRMAKSAFVGTIIAVFFLLDLLKIGVYWKMKLLTLQMLLLVSWMIPVMIIGSFLGYLLHKRIPNGLFEKIILGFVLIVSIRLIFLT